jgi:hypothetical protein
VLQFSHARTRVGHAPRRRIDEVHAEPVRAEDSQNPRLVVGLRKAWLNVSGESLIVGLDRLNAACPVSSAGV